jgi:hypothetical protein
VQYRRNPGRLQFRRGSGILRSRRGYQCAQLPNGVRCEQPQLVVMGCGKHTSAIGTVILASLLGQEFLHSVHFATGLVIQLGY